jgi:lipoprotein-anchoring transpeptidase ErfK/SrfK
VVAAVAWHGSLADCAYKVVASAILTSKMKPGEFDDLKYPRRKPWLIIILLVFVGVVVFQCYERRGRTRGNWFVPGWGAKPTPSTAEAKGPPTNGVAAAPAKPDAVAPAVPARRSQPDAGVVELLSAARVLEEQGDLVGARTKYAEILRDAKNDAIRRDLELRLGKINVELITTPRAMPEKVEYVVKKGDSLDRIAKKFGTTKELIEKSNNITKPDLIKAGDFVRVFNGKFAIAVSKGRNDLLVTMNDSFFKRYAVGTGKFGRTPVGSFVISDKVPEPPWWRPGEPEIPFGSTNNILGTRWMAIRGIAPTPDVKGYGIHGTWDDASIGKAESAGCIRMKNSDVEELFVLVPSETPVTITE